ncbi:hypothetical protein SDC9_117108 [bioreactor metagenome]|uniref:Uncharacterized protein n=1 Tax=bioreactor metagenome TaxID=1076179 RepID=A0A645BY29_9ZZZZ
MEQNKRLSDFEQFIFTLEITQTKHDFETVFQLIPFSSAYPELSFGFIPYFAASTISVIELLQKNKLISCSNDFVQIDERRLKNIRAKIKVFDAHCSTSMRILGNIDYIQDQIFKESNNFRYLSRGEQHTNLGIYFDEENRVIGNTHYWYYVMQDSRIVKKSLETIKKLYRDYPEQFSFEKNGKEAYSLAGDIGQMVVIILKMLNGGTFKDAPSVENFKPNVFYSDVNVDQRELFSNNTTVGKPIFIFVLHILTSINFVLYVVNACEKGDIGWWLKINYMAYYYCISRLRDLEKLCSRNGVADRDLSELLREVSLEAENLIKQDFRNCLMHASFSKDGKFLIADKYFDKCTPLFGLVETFFDGTSYYDFKREIMYRLTRISRILSKWLDLNTTKTLVVENHERNWISFDSLRSK